MTIDEQIVEYEKRTGIVLSAHNRATFRNMIEREDMEAAKEWLHEELQNKHGEVRK